MGVLHIGRPGGDAGTFRLLHVEVDGRRVASLRPGGRQTIELPPGSHALVGRMDWARSEPLQFETSDANDVSIEVSFPFSAAIDSFVRPRQAIKSRLTS